MKLRNIYMICRDNREGLKEFSASQTKKNGRTMMTVAGWEKASESLVNICETDTFLKEKASKLIDRIPGPYMKLNTFDVSTEEWNAISKERTELLNSMNCIIRLYEDMGIQEEQCFGIDIKLPRYHDFSEYVDCLSELNVIFSKCPFLDVENEQLSFLNVDVGSTWLTFAIIGASITGVSILLNNLLAFVDKAIIVRSHYLTLKEQKIKLENEKRDDKEKEIIKRYLTETYKTEVSTVIGELESVTGKTITNTDGDAYGRIEDYLKSMGELIDKGLQIHAAIDSTSETKALFKPLEMKYLAVDSTLELLEEKDES